MIDFKKHVSRLENALGVKNAAGKNCVDMIDEGLWWNVMYELNQSAIKCAGELQVERGGVAYPKDISFQEDAVNKITATRSIEELQKQSDGDAIVEQLQKQIGFQLNASDLVFTDSTGIILGARRFLKYPDAPPTRLLSITLILSYFLGFLDASGDHELHKGAIGAWDRIDRAYHDGFASHPNSKSKSNQSDAKTEGAS